jgi:hypothetical protein
MNMSSVLRQNIEKIQNEVKIMKLIGYHCAICGKKIEKDKDIARYGEHFDSEEHAEQYAKKNAKNQAPENEPNHTKCKSPENTLT